MTLPLVATNRRVWRVSRRVAARRPGQRPRTTGSLTVRAASTRRRSQRSLARPAIGAPRSRATQRPSSLAFCAMRSTTFASSLAERRASGCRRPESARTRGRWRWSDFRRWGRRTLRSWARRDPRTIAGRLRPTSLRRPRTGRRATASHRLPADGERALGPIDDPTVSFTPLMELAWPIAPTRSKSHPHRRRGSAI